MSKLYTESEVRKLLNEILMLSSSVDDAINSLTQIELPTDEQIEEASNKLGYGSRSVGIIHNTFQVGAKWMRDKIKGGEQC